MKFGRKKKHNQILFNFSWKGSVEHFSSTSCLKQSDIKSEDSCSAVYPVEL